MPCVLNQSSPFCPYTPDITGRMRPFPLVSFYRFAQVALRSLGTPNHQPLLSELPHLTRCPSLQRHLKEETRM